MSGGRTLLPKGDLSASAAFALGVYRENPALHANKIFGVNLNEPHWMLHQIFVSNWIAEQLKVLPKIDITRAIKIDSHERLQELIARSYILVYQVNAVN